MPVDKLQRLFYDRRLSEECVNTKDINQSVRCESGDRNGCRELFDEADNYI